MRQTIATIFLNPQPRITVIAFKRIAAGRDKFQNPVKNAARQIMIRGGATDLLVKHIGRERRMACRAENMLRQHVKPARAHHRAILFTRSDAFTRRFTFQNLKPIGRHQKRCRGFVEPVIGAANALRQAARPFRRTDMNDQIDRPPINAQIQRRGADHGAQLPLRHCRLDLASPLGC